MRVSRQPPAMQGHAGPATGAARHHQVRVAQEAGRLRQDLAQPLVCLTGGAAPLLQRRGGDQSPGEETDTPFHGRKVHIKSALLGKKGAKGGSDCGSWREVPIQLFQRFDSLYNQRQTVTPILGNETPEEEQINTEQIEVVVLLI